MVPTLITPLRILADSSSAVSAMRSVVDPIVSTLCILAAVICGGFLVNAGIHYMTSSGKPEKLAHAKKVMRDSLLGLVLILGAATLASILTHAYGSPGSEPSVHLPTLAVIKQNSAPFSLVGILIKAITGVLQDIVQSVGQPFINALQYFTSGTPLMAENNSVFNLWLIIVAIADVLFVLMVCMIGFNVMSASTFGFDEIDFRHLLPELGLVFLLMNSSIFAVDTIISLSNGMINAIHAGFGDTNVWQVLSGIADKSGGLGLAGLLIMVVFIVLAFILLVYYVGRLVTLYLGAALAPLLLLLWLLPSFKDFAASAAKTYISTIFVLFVHVVILLLAGSIFATLTNNGSQAPDPLMSLVVGLSTLVALLKTQGVLAQLSYASVGPKSIRALSSQFKRGLNQGSLGLRAAKG